MVISVSGIQTQLLSQGTIEPRFLVTIRDKSGSVLRFTNNDAITYLGEHYQPYIASVGTFSSSANFPENQATVQSFSLTFLNLPITLGETQHTYLSKSFDSFDWELADVDVELLLTSGTNTTVGMANVSEAIAMPVVSSGIVGTPQGVTRESFALPITTRNSKLNDLIPMRVVTATDFPEADKDELNSRTYLPIVVGSGVRLRAVSTIAGATTTVRTEVSAGTTLEVSDVSGFSPGDDFTIGGQFSQIFTIGTVNSETNTFGSITPNLNSLGVTWNVGDVVIEDKNEYSYTIANHPIESVQQVFVFRSGEDEPILIDPSAYTLVHVADALAISGTRADLQINQLFPIGAAVSGSVTQQPDTEVDNGIHDHNVSLGGGETTTIVFANATVPTEASTANDGNPNTSYFIVSNTAEDEFDYTSWPTVVGTNVGYRMYILSSSSVGGAGKTLDIRHSTSATLLSIDNPHSKGEFRTSFTTSSPTSDNRIILVGDPTNASVFEGWKEVTAVPTVNESTANLTNTTLIQNVAINVSGANLEIGDKVEVVVRGLEGADWTDPVLTSGTITRPDMVMRWFLTEALQQTEEIIDLESYSASGAQYDAEGINIQLAVQQPITLDRLFDQIANNSRSTHWWGRDGHNLHFLKDADDVVTDGAVNTVEENLNGVTALEWQDATSVKDIRNKLTALYRRDWSQTQTKDESYTGRVLGEDTDSIVKYGEITNEVRGNEREIFLDLSPTENQAQDIINFITGTKAFPRKLFRIQSDWSRLNLEPGDILDVRPVTTNPAFARVTQVRVDPRLFVEVEAVEVANSASTPPEPDPVFNQSASILSANGQQLRNLTNVDYGLTGANASFTIFYRWKQISSLGHPSTPYNMISFEGDSGSTNTFTWSNKQTGSRDWRFILRDGTNVKDYTRSNFFSSFGAWFEVAVTWDDDTQQLRFWDSGIGAMNEVLSLTKTIDDEVHFQAGVLNNISFERMRGFHLHEAAMWNRALTQDEMGGIINNQESEYDLNNNGIRYMGATNLIKWWRLGFNPEDIGKDYALGPGTRVNLIVPDGVGIGPGQLILSAP